MSKKKNYDKQTAEKQFKNAIFETLSKKIPGAHVDAEGLVRVPVRVSRSREPEDKA